MAEDDINSWIIQHEYKPIKVLGRGSYGIVIEAEQKSTGRKVAIKRYIRPFLTVLESRQLVREIQSLINLKHPYIIKIYDIIFIPNPFSDLYIVMPLYPFDLFSLLESNIVLPDSYIKKLFHSLLSAIGYMHSAGIIHRDLKPSNILVNHDCEICICDFDMSRQLHPSKIEILDQLTNNIHCIGELSKKHESNLNGISSDLILYKNKSDILYKNVFYTIKEKMKNNKTLCKLSMLLNHAEKVEIDNNFKIEKEKITKESRGSLNNRERLNKNQINKILIESQKDRLSLHNFLTSHVTSRYYRPPEIILLEKYYNYSIDIWSAGCIFAELLQMKVSLAVKKRLPIFLGLFCFPLSPSVSPHVSPEEALFLDQMSQILSILGFPDYESLSFISNPKALTYLAKYKHLQKVEFKELMPWISDVESDLLEKMLVFNPFHRPSARECLNHIYFADSVDRIPFYQSEVQVIHGNDVDEEEDIEKLKSIVIKDIEIFKSQKEII